MSMSANPFATPAPPGGGIKWDEINGSLLLAEPISYEEHIPTTHTKAGEKSPAVRATITVLDGPKAGEVYEDTFVFPKMLQGQLRPKIGEKVLGRLIQGAAQQGKNPPWLLAEATEQDVATGVAYLNQRQAGQVAQPAPAQQQAPAQAWGQQPAAAQPQQQGASVPF